MKSLILILSMFLSLSSCSDDKKSQNENILGTWKLIETYGSDGGSIPKWTAVNNGYKYTFNSDGTLFQIDFLVMVVTI